jgi:hypothetical protein
MGCRGKNSERGDVKRFREIVLTREIPAWACPATGSTMYDVMIQKMMWGFSVGLALLKTPNVQVNRR